MIITNVKTIKGMMRVDDVGISTYCLKLKPNHNFYVEIGNLNYKQHIFTVKKDYVDNAKVKKLVDFLKNLNYKIEIGG